MHRKNQIAHLSQSFDEKRGKFERFLSDLSARLVALPPEQVDDEIRSAMNRVLEFFQIDRCSLLQLLPEKNSFRITHNADIDAVWPYPVETDIPISLFPWSTKKLAVDREAFSFARLEELPAEAVGDKPTFIDFQIHSGLYIPIAALRSSEYSLGISSVRNDHTCPEEYIPWLRLLGELFVNAIGACRS